MFAVVGLAVSGAAFSAELKPVAPGATLRYPSRLVQSATAEELAAARGMEVMLADQLIQQMRKSVPENEYMPASQSEKVFRSMLDSEYARVLGESGSLGISDLVLAEIKGGR